MKIIESKAGHVGVEHFVIEVGNEPVKLNFVQQVDDIMINSPEGDVLVSWDGNDTWRDSECMLVREGDKLKEINNMKCTWMLLKSFEPNKSLKVFVTGQRN